MKKIILFVLVVLSISSCDDSNDINNLIEEYVGVWSGNFSGDDNGIWQMTVEKSGNVFGSATSSNGTFDVTGTVESDGSISVYNNTIQIEFTGSLNSSMASGSWVSKLTGSEGIWEGEKE